MPLEEDFGDLERTLVDYLTGLDWPADIAPVTVGATLPPDWTPASPGHVLVAVDDATETHAWQKPGALSQSALVRLTAWGNAAPGTSAGSPSRAKRLARLAHAAMMRYPARPGAGVVGATDPESRAPLATCTVTVTQAPA
jgi:hypothetical protein